jgi:hypothetical protein
MGRDGFLDYWREGPAAAMPPSGDDSSPITRSSGQVRDRRLERIETIIERQQGMLAKGNDDGLIRDRQAG